MTKTQIKKLKQQILGLRWDVNRKEAKIERLARLLVDKAHAHARFTEADYRAFFRSRRIKQSWV